MGAIGGICFCAPFNMIAHDFLHSLAMHYGYPHRNTGSLRYFIKGGLFGGFVGGTFGLGLNLIYNRLVRGHI